MSINTRQELVEYCLRKLGGGVVNVEVTEEQLFDRVEDSIEYYNEYHFDGIQRDYVIKKITATVVSVPDVSGFNLNDTLLVIEKNIQTSITAINPVDNTITVAVCKKPFGVNISANDIITNGTIQATVSLVTLGDADKGYIEVPENIVGVLKVLNLTSVMSSGDYMFNAQYQIMMSEIQNLTSGGTSYLYGALSYLGHLDYILRKERDFRFNRREGKIFIDINWRADVRVGEYMAIEVYRAIDDRTYSKMLNDRWLKEYTTAMIKQQWGQNLKKYSGMELPGGLKYDGQLIYEEATKEIEMLKDEAISSSAPLEFLMG